MKFSFVLAASFLSLATAHMCAFEPIQRGGVSGAQSPHADVCFQQTGPCPNMTVGAPGAAYVPGQKVSVAMQKNLDHYYASAPGNFSVFLWTGDYKTSWFMGSINDSPAPTMSLYNVNFQLPSSLSGGPYVVQTVYFTNNPGAPPNFYQCSDVLVVSANATEVEAAKHHDCTKHHDE